MKLMSKPLALPGPKTEQTSSFSFLRSRPWSTNTQVSCLPMALASMAASTEESTPPDRAQSTLPLPMRSRRACDVVLHKGVHLPVAGAAADVVHKVAQHLLALSGVEHLRVELDGVQALFLVFRSGHRAVDGVGRDLEVRALPAQCSRCGSSSRWWRAAHR